MLRGLNLDGGGDMEGLFQEMRFNLSLEMSGS